MDSILNFSKIFFFNSLTTSAFLKEYKTTQSMTRCFKLKVNFLLIVTTPKDVKFVLHVRPFWAAACEIAD